MSFRITNDSWDGHYIIYVKYGEAQFEKDQMSIPYIYTRKIQYVAFVLTVWGGFNGFANKETFVAKLAHGSQVMIGHPSERDFKSMVR